MKREIKVGQRMIGSASPVFVIAEAGINHNGNVNLAHKLVDAAADSGVDAVKFQTFRADSLLRATGERLAQQDEAGESAYHMFRRMELSLDDHVKLMRHALDRGIVFLSTAFDEESADFLDRIGVPALKIASADINHTPLLRRIAGKGKPILLSTGMAYLHEVADALTVLRQGGADEILLLHCVSLYPAAPRDLNLRAIQTLREQFSMPVGFSDHSSGIIMPLAAVALGAVAVEKHFTLDRNAPGPDHKLSLNPAEMKVLTDSIREVEAGLGDGRKRPAPGEEESRRSSRRSIVAAVDIRAYETIAPWMLAFKRPAGGLEPRAADRMIGMRARRNIPKDALIQWEDLGAETLPQTNAEEIAAAPSGAELVENLAVPAGNQHA